MIKKLICFAVLLVMAFSLAACDEVLARQIAELQREQTQQAGKIAELEEKLAEKDAKILELEEELGKQADKIGEFEEVIENQADKIAELEKELAEKDLIIAELEQELHMMKTWGHYYEKYLTAVEWGYQRTIGIFVATLLGDDGDRNDGSDAGLSAYQAYVKYHPDYTDDEAAWKEQLIDGQLLSGRIITLQRAYDIGLVTFEELKAIAKYPSPRTTLVYAVLYGQLDEETQRKIYSAIFPSGIVVSSFGQTEYRGTYENCIALALGVKYDGAAQSTYETIGGITIPVSSTRDGSRMAVYYE